MDTQPPLPPANPTAPSGAGPLTPDATKPTSHVRTFASDMEMLKKGGTVAQAKAPVLAAPTRPISSTPPPPPPSPPVIPAPSRVVMSNLPSMPVTGNQPPAPAAKPSPLETYSGDFSERMKKNEASTATVIAAEQDALPTPVQGVPEKRPLSTILYSIGGAVLLVASGVGVYFAYTTYLSGSAPVLLIPVVTAPIFVDDREQVFGTGTALLQEIEQSVTRSLPKGTVRLLYLEDATTTTVFAALQLPAPGGLLRNIVAAQSMAGVANAGDTQSPFFILSVSAYGESFAGMLQWEGRMPRDLSKLFLPYPPPTIATTTTATSTPAAPALVPGFRDEVVANHDTRTYRDEGGHSIILYGYWNQTTLVIARDAAAFAEVIGRLATSRAQ